MIKHMVAFAVIGIISLGASAGTEARDKIRIVGSPAVLPFVQTVAENFALHFEHPSPSIDVTGVGKGFRLFCAGIGFQHPDLNATARPISDAELAYCQKSGVAAVVEIMVGLDAIAVVNSTASEQVDFTTAHLFSALSAKVPRDGRIVENRHSTWYEIDPTLPALPIRVMGPAPNSSHYDAFAELVMESGCLVFPGMDRLSAEERYQLCRNPRRDEVFVSGLNNESAILGWLRDNPDAFGIVPLSLVAHYPEYVRANRIEGAAPTATAIAGGRYPLVRPIYLYVKRQHVAAVPGLQEFLYEFTGERAIGPDGYLVENDFLYLNDQGRNRARDFALSLEALDR